MTKPLAALVIAVLSATPLPGSAQTRFGIGAKAGLLGIGAEAAVSLGDMLVIRGGAGFMPLEFSQEYRFTDYSLEFPGAMNLGVDLHPGGGSFRISGGFILRTEDPSLTAVIDTTVNLNGTVYEGSDVGSLVGTVVSKSAAPFVAIGFGHFTNGIGLFLDLGVAWWGDPELTLEASENNSVTNDPAFEADLEAYGQGFEEDLDTYLKVFPIVQLGIKIGFGGG